MKICRRDILKGFAAWAGGIFIDSITNPLQILYAAQDKTLVKREYKKVLLTDENKEPFRASDIKKNENYFFFTHITISLFYCSILMKQLSL